MSNEDGSVTDFSSCVPAPGGGMHGPGVRGIGNPYLFGLAPPGTRIDVSVPDHARPPALGKTHEAGENPPQFPRFRRQPGQPLSPPHRPPPRTAPGSSSSFCFQTSGLLRPPSSAPHRYPGRKIQGHGHQIVAVRGTDNSTMSFKTFYYITICLASGLLFPTRGLFPDTYTHQFAPYVHVF